jgi:hypothetical protein
VILNELGVEETVKLELCPQLSGVPPPTPESMSKICTRREVSPVSIPRSQQPGVNPFAAVAAASVVGM